MRLQIWNFVVEYDRLRKADDFRFYLRVLFKLANGKLMRLQERNNNIVKYLHLLLEQEEQEREDFIETVPSF